MSERNTTTTTNMKKLKIAERIWGYSGGYAHCKRKSD